MNIVNIDFRFKKPEKNIHTYEAIAKEKVPHGGWENWLQKGSSELPFCTHVQAKKHMKFAKNKILVLEYFNKNQLTINQSDGLVFFFALYHCWFLRQSNVQLF